MNKEQEPVEPGGLVITSMTPGSAIEANFDALKESIAAIVEGYKDVVITRDQVPQAKRDRAYIRGVSKSLNQRRIEVKRQYMAPIEVFEAKIKELDAPLEEAADVLDAQIKAFEEAERAAKRAELKKHYEEYAGALVEAVPFERIEDPSWTLKSTNLMAAFQVIEERVEAIARDDETLDSLGLSHPVEAHAEYFATLDLSRAIARSKELDEREARARELEAAKAEVAAMRDEPAPDEPRTWTFTVVCTRKELDAALAALKALGLNGKVR
ncbi:MAG: DUF1351 domain-containing protein [Coriobacteriales bacterium]